MGQSEKQLNSRQHTLPSASRPRSGCLSDFTPRKVAKICHVSENNHPESLRHYIIKINEVQRFRLRGRRGLVDISGSASLTFTRRIESAPSSIEHPRAAKGTSTVTTRFTRTRLGHISSVRGRKYVFSLRIRRWTDLIEVHRKSRTPKAMFIYATPRPELARNIDVKTGIRRNHVIKEARRGATRRKRGKEDECGVTIDLEWYQELYM